MWIYITNPLKNNSKLLTIGELLDTIEKNGKKKRRRRRKIGNLRNALNIYI